MDWPSHLINVVGHKLASSCPFKWYPYTVELLMVLWESRISRHFVRWLPRKNVFKKLRMLLQASLDVCHPSNMSWPMDGWRKNNAKNPSQIGSIQIIIFSSQDWMDDPIFGGSLRSYARFFFYTQSHVDEHSCRRRCYRFHNLLLVLHINATWLWLFKSKKKKV